MENSISKNFPGVIENRRGASGVRTWEGEPGEHHLSFNGELEDFGERMEELLKPWLGLVLVQPTF